MDASKTAEAEDATAETGTGTGEDADSVATPATRTRPWSRRPGRRTTAALAALLAAAIAVPLVLLPDDSAPPAPRPDKRERPGPVDADEAARRAKATGKDVEVTAERTARTTTWAQPDGTMRLRTHLRAVRALVDGQWRKIDTDLERVKGGFSPKAVNDPIVFSDGTAPERSSRAGGRAPLASQQGRSTQDGNEWSALVQFSTGGHEMTVSWPGPVPAPTVDGPRALYEEIRPGIDLLMTARDGAFSHLLIVKNREAAADPLLDSLEYQLQSADLTFSLDTKTNVVRAKDAEGAEMAVAPTPFMWDSAGLPAETDAGSLDAESETGSEPDDESSQAPAPEATPSDSLELPGLAGPEPGSHDAVAAAQLAADNLLTITPDRALLDDEDTVYPVFVDPSFKGRKHEWALAYDNYPNSNFLNGQNFNDGTDEARVGYESRTGGKSRSFFELDLSPSLAGATVSTATFRALETYSWSCDGRVVEVWRTGSIGSSTTWNNQPSWSEHLDSRDVAHGWKSSQCPDSYVAFDVKDAMNNVLGTSKLTLGLRASETSAYAWKKFQANGENAPYVEIVYNRPPYEPYASSMEMTPGPNCDLESPYATVGKSDLTFEAKAKDPDGNLEFLHLRVWPTGDMPSAVIDDDVTPNSTGAITKTIPWESFTHGVQYSWDVRSVDTWNAASTHAPPGTIPCRFVVDHTRPNSPVVSSQEFPPPGDDGSTWSSVRFGTSGTFTFTADGSADVKRYEYSLNTTTYDSTATPGTTGGSVTVNMNPTFAGPNQLYVRSVDTANNVSGPTKYLFYVTPKTGLDSPGDVTGDAFPDVYTIDDLGNLRVYASDGAGDLHIGMVGAYATSNGQPADLQDGYWTGALITHNGDWLPGDGIQDLIARRDGKLWLYPGDGYGGVDTSGTQREILLPDNAPDPASLTQILSIGDTTADGYPDLFATAGDQLWAFTGYTGASFTDAILLLDNGWTERDIVLVGDVTGDGAFDLLYRTDISGRLLLRQGKKAGDGTDLDSLATAAGSATGVDGEYGATGWHNADVPIIAGVPDADGDDIPDLWALRADGGVHFYPGGRTTHGSPTQVITSTDGYDWVTRTAIG